MRLRFFFIIFLVLSVVGISTSILYKYLLHQDRIRLIDQQVRDTATALLGSELAELNKIRIEKAEEIISEELGENRIGKFFIVRGEHHQILYQSGSAKLLSIGEIPQTPQWITINSKGQYIRVLNLALPKIEGRTLQVGLIIGDEILSPPFLSKHSLIYFAVTLFIGLFVSFFLTSILLKPIKNISDFILEIASTKSSTHTLPGLPKRFFKKKFYTPKDEYYRLIYGFNMLIERVNKGFSTSKLWSYQMAHELKTPLAIMDTEVEVAFRQNNISADLKSYLQKEISTLSDTISAFLNWAEIENANLISPLHSLKASQIITDISERLSRKYTNRIKIVITKDFFIEANPYHLELLLQNLLINALNYSASTQTVEIEINSNYVRIIDMGIGIPDEVMKRLGEPFNFTKNKFSQTKGHGLGLAFIYSISKLYNWKVEVQTGRSGTIITIYFHSI